MLVHLKSGARLRNSHHLSDTEAVAEVVEGVIPESGNCQCQCVLFLADFTQTLFLAKDFTCSSPELGGESVSRLPDVFPTLPP